MTTKRLIPLLVVLLAVLVSGCSASTQAAARDTAAVDQSPREVVNAYYTWYLDYIGNPAADDFRNPLVDRTYRDSKYLSKGFVSQVDELLATPGMAMADPFLCAQDIPTEISAGEADFDGARASVPVTTSFANHRLTVNLERIDGAWMIIGIQCR